MHIFNFLSSLSLCSSLCYALSHSTAGIEALVRRRIPAHADDFKFSLSSNLTNLAANSSGQNDEYVVSNGNNGTIDITGNSPIALASGLRWYLSNIANVDIWWFIGSRLHLAPAQLPRLNQTYHGTSIVPWRYHFNTVTFSYTSAFWDWDDWELQLDWMALRGINLPLAWVGYEKLLVETFQEAGFTDTDISSFLSGPAFQAWNRFGNIQGSWGNGSLPTTWIDGQFSLNKQIVKRMVELGMTPALPSFTGFVPMSVGQLYPNASAVNGSQWNGFARRYTNVTFLEPSDPLFMTLQKSFISKQTAAYGNVSNVYTLDQYNENDPFSGDLDYLKSVSSGNVASLKAANPSAIWLIQGWLFYSSQDFWTNDRVEAYLGGVNDSDILILDLFSESQPQWQRTSNYFGKPWIWCELHDYGGNMGLYGQVDSVTINPIQALANISSSMVGVGLTMEGEEGNEIMYDLLLDQAWDKQPINTGNYFRSWVDSRYHGASSLPNELYYAWNLMRKTVYNNTNLNAAQATTKSIIELAPNTTGLLNRTGHHPTTITYNPTVLTEAWEHFYNAAVREPTLWDNEAYTFDLTDITRQVLANAFNPLYIEFVKAANSSLDGTYSPAKASKIGEQMTSLLLDLDAVLTANGNAQFSLPAWIAAARAWASPTDVTNKSSTNSSSTTRIASFYEYNARNQVTLWGPMGEISDYASKQWGGLIRSYYVPRWQLFINYTLSNGTKVNGENAALESILLTFEEDWQGQTWGEALGESYTAPRQGELQRTIAKVVQAWPDVFEHS